MNIDVKFPCPCCGHRVHDREPGHHQTCPICLWEDELAQLRFPTMPGVSNAVSLFEGQQNYISFGVSARKNKGLGRKPLDGEVLDEGWRPLNSGKDSFEQPVRGEDYAETYPWKDTSVLYYWRPTYWRRLSG